MKFFTFIPGFRSLKVWKVIIAVIYYLIALMALLADTIGLTLMMIACPYIVFGIVDLIRRKKPLFFIIGFVLFFAGIILVANTPDTPTSDTEPVATETVTPTPLSTPTPAPTPTTEITPQPTEISSDFTAEERAEMEENDRLEKERSDYLLSCDSTVSYDSLARDPEYYKGKRIILRGEVAQIISENGLNVSLRVNITLKDAEFNLWTDDVTVSYTKRSANESRILEGDVINIGGVYEGLKSYEMSIGNSTVQFPHIQAKYIF